MNKVLIVYGTTEGQTRKIAEAMGRSLAKMGLGFELASGADAPRGAALDAYRGVIVGSSIHMTKFHPDVQHWVKDHASRLNNKASAFFSVCLGILEKQNAKAQKDERDIVDSLYHVTGWRPGMDAIFAGALKYSQYGWFKKRFLRAIAGRAGGDTDMSHDYEYTDWAEVEAFARRFGSQFVSVGSDSVSA